MKADIVTDCQNRNRLALKGLFVFASIALVGLTGCSTVSQSKQFAASSHDQWRESGLVTIARIAPEVSPAATQVMLGLLPGSIPALAAPAQPEGIWLSVNRHSGTVELMQGSELLSKAKVEGLENLKPGKFNMLLKQRNPLWYAPESYFASRNLPVPPAGDRSRFRRGALGDFVIFLDKQTPLHSGPVWTPDIGGVRFQENDLSKIYYQLNVGAPIQVE